MNMMFDGFFQFISIFIFFHQLFQCRVIYQLCNTQFFRITVHMCGQIYHQVGQNFYISFFCLNPHKRNCRILDRSCQFFCYFCTCFCQDLTCGSIHYVFSQYMTADTVFQMQFFIEFISTYFSQIVTLRIKEHACDQTSCAVHCQRFARTDLLIQL